VYEIPAAIIGGVVAGVLNGAVVFSALFLTERRARAKEREDQLVAGIQQAEILMPAALVGFGRNQPDDVRNWQELKLTLARMQVAAVGVKDARGDKLRLALRDLVERVTAAQLRGAVEGRTLTLWEVTVVGDLRELNHLLQPGSQVDIHSFHRYMTEGFGDEPSAD
jgi:hypothetical protein